MRAATVLALGLILCSCQKAQVANSADEQTQQWMAADFVAENDTNTTAAMPPDNAVPPASIDNASAQALAAQSEIMRLEHEQADMKVKLRDAEERAERAEWEAHEAKEETDRQSSGKLYVPHP